MIKLSNRVIEIVPSPTLTIDNKFKEMKKSGIDVIGFGAGEPDFNTPEYIKNAAINALNDNFTHYTSSSGIPELKSAICKKLKKDNDLNYEPESIIISNGAKHTITNVILSLCQTGDEVILPVPYWVSYLEIIKLSGATPVLLQTSFENFKINADSLKSAITPKTKLLILNSPNNPTGSVYSKEELTEISKVLVKYNICVLSDEIYEKFIYEKTHVSIASLGKKIKDLTIVVNGVSKAYAMTGFRIGYSASLPILTKAMANIQSHMTSNPNSIAQKAAVSALCEDDSFIEKMRKEYKARRECIIKLLRQIPGIEVFLPDGAFYVFANIKKLLPFKIGENLIKTSTEFCETLLRHALVAAVPGIAFGNDDYIRLSFATDMNSIETGMTRLSNFVAELKTYG